MSNFQIEFSFEHHHYTADVSVIEGQDHTQYSINGLFQGIGRRLAAFSGPWHYYLIYNDVDMFLKKSDLAYYATQ